MTDDSNCIGKYIIHDGRVIRSQKSKIVPEKDKIKFLDILATTSVEKQYAPEPKKLEKRESEMQTVEKNKPEVTWLRNCPPVTFGPVLDVLIQDPKHENLQGFFTKPGIDALGSTVRFLIISIIEKAKMNAHHANRKRIIPDDVDLALTMLKLNNNTICPMMNSTPHSERWFWGRKCTQPPPFAKSVTSKECLANERFCDSLIIKDHWLCIEGVQPLVPENSVPTEVREKNHQAIIDAQRLPQSIPKKDIMAEKRITKQLLSVEHQILYNELVNLLTNGTSLERQKALQCIEADTGLQFLSGRFVILFAEGIRVNIGTRNSRAISNLLKLAWSLMKNKNIRMERYLYVLIPSLISCIVTKTIIPLQDSGKSKNRRPDSLTQEDEERLVRDLETETRIREAASKILFELNEQYPLLGIQMRIILVIRRVLTGQSDPSAVYGALCMLFNFGYLTIKNTIIPRLHDIYCGLVTYCDEEAVSSRIDATIRNRKMIVETEMKRVELARNRVVELIMKILYEYESCEIEPRMVDETLFRQSYAEFGAMFSRFLIETGKIDDDGRVVPSAKPILHSVGVFNTKAAQNAAQLPQAAQPARTQAPKKEIIDEEMLMMTDLLDDSHRKFREVAKKIEDEQEESRPSAGLKDSFFGNPKLVLIRRVGDKITYIRPLELAHIPSLPTTTKLSAAKKSESSASASVAAARHSRSTIDAADAPPPSADASEALFRRYVSRAPQQSAAVVYGRPLEMSADGHKRIDEKIAEVARKLGQTRLRNSINSLGYEVPYRARNEKNRGKFLAQPLTQRL